MRQYAWTKLSEKDESAARFEDTVPGTPVGRLQHYEITDPDGDHLCVVHTEGEAETLVSHLNR